MNDPRYGSTLPASVLALALAVGFSPAQAASPTAAAACPAENTGITLSPGFCATIFADDLGHIRHMTVTPEGVVYANSWSGRYFHNDTPPAGGFLLALEDTKGTGHADVVERFGDKPSSGAAGGSGIALYKNALYVERNDEIVRYTLAPGHIVPSGKPEVILSGMPLTGDHPMHPFVIDAHGNLFVDMGSATNACQAQNRQLHSAGLQPCTELETRAGT
jgi:glucose/arabinose dehydrogenase